MEILVKAWGNVVGKLNDDNGINKFSLSPKNSLDFSPIKLTQKAKTYDFSHLAYQNGLPGLINDSLPGIYGKEYLDVFFMKHFKFKPTFLETLLFLGDNTMGALTFEPKMQTSELRKSAILDAKELYAETKNALIGESSLSINEVIAISNSAASGARPKAIVGFNPHNQKVYVGTKYQELPNGFKHSIIKFDNLIFGSTTQGLSPIQETSQTRVEYIYSLLGKEAGIKMANTYLLEADGHAHFVTERFDITRENDGTLERKHMHSLSGIFHQNPAETTFDYLNLFKIADKLNVPHKDKEQLFKTMIFNLVFGNKDDHTRNFSYLMDKEGKWRVSPSYDITFTSNKKHQMLFNYKNGYDVKISDMKIIADKYKIRNWKEYIELIVELKYTRLLELTKEHGLKELPQKIISSTNKIFE